ncbi:DNA-binding MarR family transcriptional regulator [Paenarthrobacter nicotinovorans]|uniref:Transcriptional regulator n=1 Tax=Paenarthrobacter nicotinovorans TaxID=29320 RepID=A0ABV0GMU9_PAENI|nr:MULTISPECIES: transcriptional regulator [Micrococcaceae]MDR6437030.1 DNA-binding MarR family transcriptional regulator [Paenarthrobacter nicotinovorans]SCZ54807.1 DNA-binding transcriptional regulator, MarR family [Arthrobacter sp. UNCCL28]
MSTPAEHPRHQLNEVVHSPVRFSIMAALAKAESLDFKDLRDAIQVSDSVLSKQLSILEKAEFVKIKKSFAGKFPRTSASLTVAGRDVWAAHLQTLREIAGG